MGGITGPYPIPFIGNALVLLTVGIHHVIVDQVEKYGGCFLFWLGIKPMILVHDAGA